VEYANTPFDPHEYVAKKLRVRRVNQVFDFSTTAVLQGYNLSPTTPMTIEGGRFHGARIPTPDEAYTIYTRLLSPAVPSLLRDQAAVWLYENLKSSDFFNNLFAAVDHVLQAPANAPLGACSICRVTPCASLDTNPLPLWILKRQREGVTNGPKQRHETYKRVYNKSYKARVPVPDCWLLAIRCNFPGLPIVGFRPRTYKRILHMVQQPHGNLHDDLHFNFEEDDSSVDEEDGEDEDGGGDEED